MTHPPPSVAFVGPDPAVTGGMPAVIRDLLASPLAQHYTLVVIPTWRPAGLAARVAIFTLALLRITAFCLRRGPRLVHVHVTVRGSMARKAIVAVLVRALRRPLVLHVHGGANELEAFAGRLGRGPGAVVRWAFRHATRVLTVSSASAHVMRERYGARAVLVVPNPAPRAVAGSVAPAGGAHPEVLFLGGFANPVKGGRELLAAAPLLLERHPGATVNLAGPGEPPPGAVGANGAVRWLGYLDAEAKSAALRRAAVFVLPSTSEGLPVALLEAMAYGRPVVATHVGGIPDVLEAGTEGLLVAPGDPQALADAIGQLLADPQRARALGEAARRRVASLSPEVVAERIDAIYRRVLA